MKQKKVKNGLDYSTYVRCTKCEARGGRFIFSEFKTPSGARRMAKIYWNKRCNYSNEVKKEGE